MNANLDHHWLVVTDLDGTLLDHHNYDFSAARNSLELLEKKAIPVVINSSKTAAEIEQLRTELCNRHPFIAENGSGIFIPEGYFSKPPKEADYWKNFWVVTQGKSRTQLIEELSQLPQSFQANFRALHTMSTSEIMALTDLSEAQAELARQRQFSEPLQWLGTSEQKNLFFRELDKKHINFTEGGRFIHLMGHTNKGSATERLKRYYAYEYKTKIKIVALGDGNNDIDMLKSADIAVVIRSPVNPLPSFKHPCKIISEDVGPVGWTEVIQSIFC